MRESDGGAIPSRELAGLLERAGGGDADAWRRLVELYARRIFALARSRGMSAEGAEEVAQSVMVTVAQKLGSREYAESGRFEAWLFRIAMNRVRDAHRRARRRGEVSLDGAADQPAHGVVRIGSDPEREELRRLREAMGALSDADREVVELRHHAGLGFRQIADLLDEPHGTILARHHRALRKLKTMLSPEHERKTESRP